MKFDRDLQRRTAAHYEAHPFDFMTEADEAAIDAIQPPPFRTFVGKHVTGASQAAEIGCGPGRGTMYLAPKCAGLVALDISQHSLALARKRAPDARFVRATNVQLPLPDSSFDIVISDGVIHHTPDAKAAFDENARILRMGGFYYLGVYRKGGRYDFIYNRFGPPIRSLERHAFGRVLIYAAIFPVYYLAHLVKSRGKRTLRGALNFFYDYIITPRASFHSIDEITSWGEAAGLELLDYDPSLGNVHVFIFRRPAMAA